jgi:hypothetical protein
MQANFLLTKLPRSLRKAKRYVPSVPTMDKAILNWSTDQYITGFDGIQCFDGDDVYYRTNVCDPDFNFDEFNDIDNDYALLSMSDSPDGIISDEDDEMQDAFLCELEYQLNNA